MKRIHLALLGLCVVSVAAPQRSIAEGLNTGFDEAYWKKVRAAKGVPESKPEDNKAATSPSASTDSAGKSHESGSAASVSIAASSPQVCAALEKEVSKSRCFFSDTCKKPMGKCKGAQLSCKDAECIAGNGKSRRGNRERPSRRAANENRDKKPGKDVATTGSDGKGEQAHSNPQAHCEEKLRSGKVPYEKAGRANWSEENIQTLCKGVVDADERLNCFSKQIDAGVYWSSAISACTGHSHAENADPKAPITHVDSADKKTHVDPKEPVHNPEQPSDSPTQLCMKELRSGKVAWDRSGRTDWSPVNVEALCKNVTDAKSRLDCFRGKIASDVHWQAAIDQCVSGLKDPITHVPPSNPQEPPPSSGSGPERRWGKKEKLESVPTASDVTHLSPDALRKAQEVKPPKQTAPAQQTTPTIETSTKIPPSAAARAQYATPKQMTSPANEPPKEAPIAPTPRAPALAAQKAESVGPRSMIGQNELSQSSRTINDPSISNAAKKPMKFKATTPSSRVYNSPPTGWDPPFACHCENTGNKCWGKQEGITQADCIELGGRYSTGNGCLVAAPVSTQTRLRCYDGNGESCACNAVPR